MKPEMMNHFLRPFESESLPKTYIMGAVTMKNAAPIMPISIILAPILLASNGTKVMDVKKPNDAQKVEKQ